MNPRRMSQRNTPPPPNQDRESEAAGPDQSTQPHRGVRLAKHLLTVVAWVLICVGALAWALGRWIVRNFGHISPDQALMNLEGVGEGGGGTFVRDAIWQALVIPLLVIAILGFVAWLVRRSSREKGSSRAQWLARLLVLVPVLIVPVAGAWSLGSALQIRQYLASHDPSLNLADYYVLPEVDSAPTEPTNLVLIYLESIENTFADEGLFGVNMLADLQDATSQWDSVENLHQYPEGGWTMSGIVSTQCGVPLRMPPSSGVSGTQTLDHSAKLNNLDARSYLTGATCLGDVLAEQGYTNVFMGGADADFAAKGVFLADHGYSTVLDRKHWEAEGETEVTPAWGLSDGRLFANAKTELAELESDGQPFMLTILTLDTHEPAALFPACEERSAYALVDATRCSMGAVADFIDFMDTRGYLENTAVVVMGDHLKFIATGESLGADFSDYPNRTIFNRLHSPASKQVRTKEIDQLDMYPTILEAMGFTLRDGRAGLGVSAYDPDTVYGSLRQLPAKEREALIRSRSASFYAELWGES